MPAGRPAARGCCKAKASAQDSYFGRLAIARREAGAPTWGAGWLPQAVALRQAAAKKKGSRDSGSPGHKRSRKMPRDQRGREGGGGEESRDFSPNTGEILRLKACSYFTRLWFGCVSAPVVLFKPLRKSVNDLTLQRRLLGLALGSFATSVPGAGYKNEFLSRSVGLRAYAKLQKRGFPISTRDRDVPPFCVMRKCDAAGGAGSGGALAPCTGPRAAGRHAGHRRGGPVTRLQAWAGELQACRQGRPGPARHLPCGGSAAHRLAGPCLGAKAPCRRPRLECRP